MKSKVMMSKLKMPPVRKDPMLELDEEMDMAEESPEEEAAEAPEEEASEEEAAESHDLSEVSDDDLIAELEARGMTVSQAQEEAAASEEE